MPDDVVLVEAIPHAPCGKYPEDTLKFANYRLRMGASRALMALAA